MRKEKNLQKNYEEKAFQTKKEFYIDTEDGVTEYILNVKTKYYKFSLYWYNDDKEVIYLSDVQVYKKYRGNGLGNILLRHVEYEIDIINSRIPFKYLILKATNKSFVFDWYQRNGFEVYNSVDYTPYYFWLRKRLNVKFDKQLVINVLRKIIEKFDILLTDKLKHLFVDKLEEVEFEITIEHELNLPMNSAANIIDGCETVNDLIVKLEKLWRQTL